jgi:hypothetical protein
MSDLQSDALATWLRRPEAPKKHRRGLRAARALHAPQVVVDRVQAVAELSAENIVRAQTPQDQDTRASLICQRRIGFYSVGSELPHRVGAERVPSLHSEGPSQHLTYSHIGI